MRQPGARVRLRQEVAIDDPDWNDKVAFSLFRFIVKPTQLAGVLGFAAIFADKPVRLRSARRFLFEVECDEA